MKNGSVYVLEKFEISEDKTLIKGSGLLYDADRKQVSKGEQKVPLAEVALIETNVPEKIVKAEVAGMAVITGVSLFATALCIANPKACFGSCPTFYTQEGGDMVLRAEGFSNAIARSLETTDVDALMLERSTPGRFDLLMTNDALETHAVRSVRLLAAPKKGGERIYRQGELFYPSPEVKTPISCRSHTGDCLDLVAAVDDMEYRSAADETNLASPEIIELEFPGVGANSGLVIVARNSLMNTFLFYQALAYMGISADDWIMELESGGQRAEAVFGELKDLIGTMQVEVQGPDGDWIPIGQHAEVGPIAKETQILRLPDGIGNANVKARINANRGYWKIDYLGLAEIGDPVKPLVIEPYSVESRGSDDARALERILNPDEILYTYPGDAYNFSFDVPEGSFELFVESTGYYYEWIRRQWLEEEDQDEAARLLVDPEAALKRLAPAYKRIEDTAEETFWNSRFGGADAPLNAE